MVSCAQNLEDVMLWRALGSITDGRYVDVGAAWPDLDSVTKWFYDQGWRGLNVEPDPGLYHDLQANRPGDRNAWCAAGHEGGRVVLHRVHTTGLSTLSPALADQYRAGGYTVTEVDVPSRSLTALIDEHRNALGPTIHFLKIDVEGSEATVIANLDLQRIRPWIIVVEATVPGTMRPSHEEWEALVVGARYDHVYHDGLNRFYVAHEHAHLAHAFTVPPNVFDSYVTRRATDAEVIVQHLERKVIHARLAAERAHHAYAAVSAHAVAVDHAYHHATTSATELQRQYSLVVHSASWRLTRPLRALVGLFKSPEEYRPVLRQRLARLRSSVLPWRRGATAAPATHGQPDEPPTPTRSATILLQSVEPDDD